MKNTLILLYVALLCNESVAQHFQRLDIPVFVDGVSLANPWAGGMNAPQWAKSDLDNDGKDDLYVFDRNGEVHLTFRNSGGAGEAVYEFAPHLSAHFPPVENFVLMRDFNRDGAADLFTHAFESGLGPSAMKVYRGYFENGQLHFTKILFPQNVFDVLPFDFNGDIQDIEVNPPDYPAIDDLDNDGDLDILVLSNNGDKINYFQNVALEMGYTDDTLLYEIRDDCWGKVGIAPFAQSLSLSSDPEECAFNWQPNDDDDRNGGVHGGATLCSFDADDDGDREILYGDLIFPHFIYGVNGGSQETAWITAQDTIFPAYNVPATIPDFPAAFFLDVDNDGARDLLASPNIPETSPDIEVAWYYQNTGTDETPVFSLTQKDYLIDHILDFGTGARPAFADVNADGLMDLVVGNREEWIAPLEEKAYLVLLLNTGTLTEPSFEVTDLNWLDFNQFSTQTKSFTPAFGDLDGDGDVDLITGDRTGGLFFAENTAGGGQPMEFAPIQPFWKNIFVGQNSVPFIHDINQDGLADLIIGERNGNINYLPNTGAVGGPDFHPNEGEAPNNQFFGKISTQLGGIVGYSSPVVLAFPEETFIITGSEKGWMLRYLVDPDSLDGGAFELQDGKFGNLREGEITSIAFANLNNDLFIDAVVGNNRGGLGIFQTPIMVDGTVDSKEVENSFAMKLFPNPVREQLYVEFEAVLKSGSYRIFNTMGQFAAGGSIEGSNPTILVRDLPNGIYFLQFKIGEMITTRHFVKQ